jgi:predicted NBD/HSP70 family sugar kinase
VSNPQIGNSDLISEVNSRLVLQAVRVMQPTFRAAVARRTGLKPATVTVIINDLLKQRMIKEISGTAPAAPGFGRPPLMLAVNADAKRILAVDFEPDRLRVALTDLSLQERAYREKLIDRFSEPQQTLKLMVKLCREVLGKTPRNKLLGVGLSLPGLIDLERGVLISSTNLPNWHDVSIRQYLEQKLELPVRIERSVRLAALYEEWTSPHSEDQTTLILSLRTGVGFSLINRGQLYVGNCGFDGEIGHTVVDIDGQPCECGSRGCLETFVSASAICTRAKHGLATPRGAALKRRLDAGEPLNPELVYTLAREGDPLCADIVRDVGRYLGIATSNLINLLAPTEVVICGAIDMADELILRAVREQVDQSALPRSRERTVIRLAKEKQKLPLLGAAVLVAHEVFALPRLSHVSAPVPT